MTVILGVCSLYVVGALAVAATTAAWLYGDYEELIDAVLVGMVLGVIWPGIVLMGLVAIPAYLVGVWRRER
jgi:hypothetical protein